MARTSTAAIWSSTKRVPLARGEAVAGAVMAVAAEDEAGSAAGVAAVVDAAAAGAIAAAATGSSAAPTICDLQCFLAGARNFVPLYFFMRGPCAWTRPAPLGPAHSGTFLVRLFRVRGGATPECPAPLRPAPILPAKQTMQEPSAKTPGSSRGTARRKCRACRFCG